MAPSEGATAPTLSGYQLLDCLHQGSRTLVYRATRCSNDQPVIIKVLRNPHPHFNELVQFRNQFATNTLSPSTSNRPTSSSP